MPSSTVKVKVVSQFWQLPIATLLEQLNSSPDGLSNTDASARLVRFGPNLMHADRKQALLLQFLAKFRNPLWSSFSLSPAPFQPSPETPPVSSLSAS